MSSSHKYERYARRIDLFKDLADDEISDILHRGHALHIPQGKTIFHEGQLGRTIFIVFNGTVDIFHEDTLIAKCRVGDAFGEISVLDHRPHTATAVAHTEVKLFTLDEEQINLILEQRVAVRFLLNVIHVLSSHLARMNHTVNTLEHKLKATDTPASTSDATTPE